MSATEMLQTIGNSLMSAATAKVVFGDPIQVGGKTVVPVAKVKYGFGAGFGRGPAKHHADVGKDGEGGGGGGGANASPAGALEITATETRFVRFYDTRLFVAAFIAGAFWGMLVYRIGDKYRFGSPTPKDRAPGGAYR